MQLFSAPLQCAAGVDARSFQSMEFGSGHNKIRICSSGRRIAAAAGAWLHPERRIEAAGLSAVRRRNAKKSTIGFVYANRIVEKNPGHAPAEAQILFHPRTETLIKLFVRRWIGFFAVGFFYSFSVFLFFHFISFE